MDRASFVILSQNRTQGKKEKPSQWDGFSNKNRVEISAWRTGVHVSQPLSRTTSFLDRKKYWYAFTFRIATQI